MFNSVKFGNYFLYFLLLTCWWSRHKFALLWLLDIFCSNMDAFEKLSIILQDFHSHTSWTYDCHTVTLRPVSVPCYTAVQPVFIRGDAGCRVCPARFFGYGRGVAHWVKAFVCWGETRCTLVPGVCVDRWVSIAAAGQSHRQTVVLLIRRREWEKCVSGRV